MKDELVRRLLSRLSKDELVDLVLGAEPEAPPPAAPAAKAARARAKAGATKEVRNGREHVGWRRGKLLVRCLTCDHETLVGRATFRRNGCARCASKKRAAEHGMPGRPAKGGDDDPPGAPPPSGEELRARLQALLRPGEATTLTLGEWGDLLGYPIPSGRKGTGRRLALTRALTRAVGGSGGELRAHRNGTSLRVERG